MIYFRAKTPVDGGKPRDLAAFAGWTASRLRARHHSPGKWRQSYSRGGIYRVDGANPAGAAHHGKKSDGSDDTPDPSPATPAS